MATDTELQDLSGISLGVRGQEHGISQTTLADESGENPHPMSDDSQSSHPKPSAEGQNSRASSEHEGSVLESQESLHSTPHGDDIQPDIESITPHHAQTQSEPPSTSFFTRIFRKLGVWRRGLVLAILATPPVPLFVRIFRKQGGWQLGLRLAIFATAIVFIVNLCSLIYVLARFGFHNDNLLPQLEETGCKKTALYSRYLHLLLNVLATLALGATNYTMQILASPIRDDLDRAHKEGVWLHFGVSGLKNLRPRRIGWRRVLTIGALFLSSFPIHTL